jgi:hypothetical protein
MPFSKFFAAALGALAAVSVAPRGAQAAPVPNARLDESVRCFVVTSMLMNMDDPQIKSVGQMGSLYFMGRLDGALPDKDLEDRLFTLSQTLNPAELKQDVAHCGEVLKARGAVIQGISARVESREKAAAAAKK